MIEVGSLVLLKATSRRSRTEINLGYHVTVPLIRSNNFWSGRHHVSVESSKKFSDLTMPGETYVFDNEEFDVISPPLVAASKD